MGNDIRKISENLIIVILFIFSLVSSSAKKYEDRTNENQSERKMFLVDTF